MLWAVQGGAGSCSTAAKRVGLGSLWPSPSALVDTVRGVALFPLLSRSVEGVVSTSTEEDDDALAEVEDEIDEDETHNVSCGPHPRWSGPHRLKWVGSEKCGFQQKVNSKSVTLRRLPSGVTVSDVQASTAHAVAKQVLSN